MSAIIRQQLQPLLLDILADVAQGPPLEALPNELCSLDAISSTSENLARTLAVTKELLKEWTFVLASPNSDIRGEENVLFSNFLVGGKSPGEIIAKGHGVQTKLDIKIDRIRSLAPPPPPTQGPFSAPVIRPQINLPALQLPDFDGHEGNWPSFWAAFAHTIHDNASLTGAQKLTYLVGRLRGNARTLVDGFALTDPNYLIVVDLLKGRYGDDDKRADRLRSELFHLVKPTGHSSSLRAFSENVDRICRQLESLGNNLDDNPFLTVAIKEKLPTEIKAQLFDKEMEEGGPWTSKQWRERLARVVKLKEAVHAPWDTNPGPTQPHPPRAPPRFVEPVRRSFPVVGDSRNGNGYRECSLCLSDGHKPSNCCLYRTVDQRRARLAEQGRCFLCAREGHRHDRCSSKAACFRCGEKHHLLVCPNPEKTPARGGNSVPLGPRFPMAPNFSGPKNVATHLSSVPSTSENPNIVSSISYNENPFILLPESQPQKRAYLMIKEIFVFNNNSPYPTAVPVFFDPGSQPGFISTDLVSLISPRLITEENMSVGGFLGNDPAQPMHFKSPRFSVRLRRRDGGWETVELNQTDKIIPPVEYLKEMHWKTPRGLRMEVTTKEPQILLGIREFWRFFGGSQEIFPGLFRIDTVFGPLFGGEMDSFCYPLATVPQFGPPMACGAVVQVERPDEPMNQRVPLEGTGNWSETPPEAISPRDSTAEGTVIRRKERERGKRGAKTHFAWADRPPIPESRPPWTEQISRPVLPGLFRLHALHQFRGAGGCLRHI